jgi:hypothetical protein
MLRMAHKFGIKKPLSSAAHSSLELALAIISLPSIIIMQSIPNDIKKEGRATNR